jgi:hypothetical protein
MRGSVSYLWTEIIGGFSYVAPETIGLSLTD